jgi:integrase
MDAGRPHPWSHRFQPGGARADEQASAGDPRAPLAALRRAHKGASSPYVIAFHGEAVGDVKKGFKSAAARADIPDCTSHTLRHTAGTWMAQRSVPLREIAGYLGHSETRTTELYAHHHPDFMENARKAFE